ncbi:zinc finger protein [Macleaya cordata]|uniref:Zinc finger protein n=1 Tax=Macleaya cordata TaxID=56857 RepID=A0A200Q684_MACCD|nr:zinc finger protein [Macleaya cordata]
MTVIGFAVSTMFIVFVCTRLICARIQLNAARRSFPTATRSDLGMLERGLHGLEPVVVAKFPTKKFSDEYFSPGGDAQCTVCLSEYQEKDILRILPYCGHFFHVACIDIWLQQHSTCPVCRISLRDSPEKKRLMQPMFTSAIRPTHMDSLDSHPYHCLYTSQSYSSRSIDNRRMEPIQEDQLTSELDAAETGESISIQGDRVLKSTFQESRDKRVESPSN